MKKIWNYIFRIQDIAEKVYEEDWEDIDEGDRKLLYIVFNNLRRRIFDSVMDALEIKSTPETLIVKVPEEHIIPFTALVLECYKEMNDRIYVGELNDIFPLSEMKEYYYGQKLETHLKMLLMQYNVIK